jgi:drug/metabolite transporter superfamily protein YnfA
MVGAAVGALVASLVFLVWMTFDIGGYRPSTAVGDFGQTLAAFAGAAGCWYSATHNVRHDRKAWWLLGAACFSWGTHQGVISLYDVIGNTKLPFPSLADIGNVGEILLATIAMLSFGTIRLAGSSRTKLLLDGVVFASSVLFLSWIFVIGVHHERGGGLFAQVLGLVYPVGDVLIISLAAMLMAHTPVGAKLAYGLIGFGVLATAVSDSVFEFVTNSSMSGNIDDMASTGWVVGFLLIGLAGLQPEKKHRSAQRKLPSYFEILLPYGAILLVVGGYLAAFGLHAASVALWLGGVTIVLALVRLLLTSLQNFRHIRVLYRQTAVLEEHFAAHPDLTTFEPLIPTLDWERGTEGAPAVIADMRLS